MSDRIILDGETDRIVVDGELENYLKVVPGLVTESGVWTCPDNMTHLAIPFNLHHNTLPLLYYVKDTNVDDVIDVYANRGALFVDWNKIFNEKLGNYYGIIEVYYSNPNSSSIYGYYQNFTYSSDEPYDESVTPSGTRNPNFFYPRYHVTEEMITARNFFEVNRFWIAGHTFKWFAVWLPEEV